MIQQVLYSLDNARFGTPRAASTSTVLRLTLVALALVCLSSILFGCTSESTGPEELQKMPALNLFANPVSDSSETYFSSDEGDAEEREFTVAFPDSVLSRIGDVDDIWVFYTYPDNCRPREISVYNFIDEEWQPIEAETVDGHCMWDPISHEQLLGSFEINPRDCFISEELTLMIRGALWWQPSARLLRYKSDYAFIVTDPFNRPYYESLGFDGQNVWASIGSAEGDSIVVYDLTGARQRSFWFPGVWTAGMAWTGSEFWVVEVGNPPRLARLSSEGVLTEAFTIPVTYWDEVRGGIAWADSLIWLPHNDGGYSRSPNMKMIAIDPIASVASGEAITVKELAVPSTFRNMAGLVYGDAELLVVAREFPRYRLYRMSLSGDVDDGQLLNVEAGPITWDGESVWMLHSGPLGSATGGSLLSRFTYP